MTLTLPDPTRLAFAACYLLLAVALAGAAYVTGKYTGYQTTLVKPALCKGDDGFVHCLTELVASQGAIGASVGCDASRAAGRYTCKVSTLGSCFAVTAHRTREGFPVTDSVAEESC